MSSANVAGLGLAALGVLTMWLVGQGRWWGWAVALAAQPVWAAFFVSVGSWTLVLSPAMYAVVYARNLVRWHAAKEATDGCLPVR